MQILSVGHHDRSDLTETVVKIPHVGGVDYEFLVLLHDAAVLF